jgi:hypothetical protein
VSYSKLGRSQFGSDEELALALELALEQKQSPVLTHWMPLLKCYFHSLRVEALKKTL